MIPIGSMIAGKPCRAVWHMPRGVFALERGGDVVAICWSWSLEARYRPGDVVLASAATLEAMGWSAPAQRAAA